MHRYKRPESVLVVVYDPTTFRVLMLQRCDDSSFWQSITGSMESDETSHQTAVRESVEELGLDSTYVDKCLHDCHKTVQFEIFPQFRHRYAKGTTHCREHWFLLPLSEDEHIKLSEHSTYQWIDAKSAVELTKSWNNAQAINEFIVQKQRYEE